MSKKLLKVLLILTLSIGLAATSYAQETGSIRGVVTDEEGNLLPGVTVTATSPALMGAQSYVTTETGSYRFPALPPGHYKVVAEMPGFKTVSRSEIIVRVGMVLTIDITMEMTTIEEEVTVTAASPVVDVEQTKISVIMDKELLKNIPMARDLYDIVNSAPGAISEDVTYRRTSSIHGGTVRSNTYAFDGVNMNDPVVMYPLTNINFDVMDEVEMVMGGLPASVGYTDGAYINVVTRSGGNRFSGGAVVYYTNDSMSQSLWTDEQVSAIGVTQPEVDKSWLDGSLTFGGPIIPDRLWFFSNARYIRQELITNFRTEPGKDYWEDILGIKHYSYNWDHKELMGFIKLTSQLTSNIKLMGMFNYVDRYRPMYEQPGSGTCYNAVRVWDHEKDYTGTGVLSYIVNQNFFFDIRASYVHRWFPLPLMNMDLDLASGSLLQQWIDNGWIASANVLDLPYVYDYADRYGGLTTARFNETYLRKRAQAGIYFTLFQDNLLGGNHEIKGGVEYEDAYGDWDWWRKDNMLWYWYGDPYYWGEPWGLLYFYTCSTGEGTSKIIDKGGRIGAYLQDSATFGERLTVNIGLRYDRSFGWKPAVEKENSAALSYYLGENIVKPWVAENYPDEFPAGLNPWAAGATEDWKNIMVWNAFSPRIGFTYDLFGDGKTAIKASFSRYTEYLMLQYFSVLHPYYPRSYGFNWYDTNGDGFPNIPTGAADDDIYEFRPSDVRGFDPEFAKKQLDPDATSPYNDEFTVGVWHELFKNFSLGLNFIYKNKQNILEDVRYDPDNDQYWYHMDQDAAQDYWLPFRTTVPSHPDSEFPEGTDVTIYVYKNFPASPATFYRLTNVPELKRKYWAFEFIFNKRMADGWQFSGSVVYSKAYGNIGGWYGESWGWSGAGDSPNFFVNNDGRTSVDRPLQIKLMGTAQLPYRIFLSAYYRFFSGSPQNRGASIRPPADWCTENNAYRTYWGVNIENPGDRRGRSWNILDVRLEKEFRIGDYGRLGLYIDVLNVLGWSGVGIGWEDIYRWNPTSEGFISGMTHDNYTDYGSASWNSGYQAISSVSGRRTLKVSARFSF